MHKIRCDTYHVRAIAEVLGEERRHVPHWHWTAEEFTAISRRQADMRPVITKLKARDNG